MRWVRHVAPIGDMNIIQNLAGDMNGGDKKHTMHKLEELKWILM
jgi:hypothetical protein